MRKTKKGFSLLELIIAIGVLAVGLVGILRIFPVGLRASRRAGMVTKAAFIARNRIEEIKMADFEDISALPPRIPLGGKSGDFEWQAKIEDADIEGLEGSPDIKKVILTITWPERGKERSEEFVTYVTR